MIQPGRVLLLSVPAMLALAMVGAGVAGRPAGAMVDASRFVEAPTVTVGDADGDGFPEASGAGLAGGPCGCRCPVMGADAGATAAGQELTAGTGTALVVCGTRVAAAADPNRPDAGTTPEVGGRVRLDPGG